MKSSSLMMSQGEKSLENDRNTDKEYSNWESKFNDMQHLHWIMSEIMSVSNQVDD